MSPIPANPALVPPGALGAPVTPPTRPGARTPADRATAPDGARRTPPGAPAPGGSFADALSQAGAAGQLQFSKHALARVQRRGIELDPSTLGRLSQGVDRAAGKGSRDSLVLVDGTAFVVSVSNRTVVTAVGGEHMKESVFTNIDSAVIA
ncbi:MAG TPA: TIGR02530 family flagellar biosynthesis protein [Solirubrobacteraceae bacterium]|nr:TIGR02530 family flagellar biosynthesis protein [Solirubrobacteraceae bacterium]